MTDQEKQMAIQKLLETEDFVETLCATTNEEEVQELFRNNGVEISGEEIDNLARAIEIGARNGELSDDDLEEVAGGLLIPVPIAPSLIISRKLYPWIEKIIRKKYKRRLKELNATQLNTILEILNKK